jgi:hypothetical protein
MKAHRAKQKELGIGPFSQEAKAKNSETMKATLAIHKALGIGSHSQEANAKRSESVKATWAKQKELGIGRYSQEAKAKRSETLLANWANKQPRTSYHAHVAPEVRAADLAAANRAANQAIENSPTVAWMHPSHSTSQANGSSQSATSMHPSHTQRESIAHIDQQGLLQPHMDHPVGNGQNSAWLHSSHPQGDAPSPHGSPNSTNFDPLSFLNLEEW